jgi:hypothetical protein
MPNGAVQNFCKEFNAWGRIKWDNRHIKRKPTIFSLLHIKIINLNAKWQLKI